MAKQNILLIIGAVGIVSSALFYTIYFGPQISPAPPPDPAVHVYNNPQISLANITLNVFYVVPPDKIDRIPKNWHKLVSGRLENISAFHALQFRGNSDISLTLHPEPIILEQESIFYDTASTDRGNAQALKTIGEELERRMRERGGDLFESYNTMQDTLAYQVLGILYEGVGAAGGIIFSDTATSKEEIADKFNIAATQILIVDINFADGFFILNRAFLTDPTYRAYGNTLFYHEFAHTLGLPDQYTSPERPDIMGTGRYRPLDINYIDRSLTKSMGL